MIREFLQVVCKSNSCQKRWADYDVEKTLKGLVERIPYPIGRIMAMVPFGVRPGKRYVTAKAECQLFDCSDCSIKQLGEKREAYAVEHFRKVFEYAREKFPCLAAFA